MPVKINPSVYRLSDRELERRILQRIAPTTQLYARQDAPYLTGHLQRNLNAEVIQGNLEVGDTQGKVEYMEIQEEQKHFIRDAVKAVSRRTLPRAAKRVIRNMLR